MFLKKLSPASANFRKSEATERWCSFCFTVSSHGTNFSDTSQAQCLVKIPVHKSEKIPCSLATSLMVSLLPEVKFSHYRPCVAQRVGRGIALLFHDCSTRRG